MRKQFLAMFLLTVSLISCSSCSSDSSSGVKSYRDENDNYIIETDGRRDVMTSELPISVPYNDKSITLTDVSCYQNCADYSYNLFIVITLDVSALDDSELHWLRESDMDVDSYITCEANDYDFDSSSSLGSILWTDTKELVFVKTSSFFKENRHGFEGSELSICVSVSQEDTYEHKSSTGETSNLNRVEEITYKMTVGDAITDAEKIEEPLYGRIADWLHSEANTFS